MDLLEYQAKELFRQVGIPVLPSQRIAQPTDVKELKIPYPIVLKSQVHRSDRGIGVHFVENPIDAIASAQAMFQLPILGEYPEMLLAEPQYAWERELYLAIVLDSATRRPLLLGSGQGGSRIDRLEHMQQAIVDQEFSPFYARRLALKMGLQGSLIQSVSAIVEKMYELFIQQDLDLVEINRLAISASGELMVLDGKVTVNDAAIGRQEGLMAMLSNGPPLSTQGNGQGSRATGPVGLQVDKPQAVVQSKSLDVSALDASALDVSVQLRSVSSCHWVRLDAKGDIGIICNGAGLAMATSDLIASEGGRPAGFVDLGGEYRVACSSYSLAERLSQGLDLMLQDKAVKVILVNLLSGNISCRQFAEMLIARLRQRASHQQHPALVVRMIGSEFRQARELLLPFGVPVVEQLDEAIALSLSYASARAAWDSQLQVSRSHPQSGEISGSQSPVPRS